MTGAAHSRVAKLEMLVPERPEQPVEFICRPEVIELMADTLDGLNPRLTRAELVAKLSKPCKLSPGGERGLLSPEAEAIVAETRRELRRYLDARSVAQPD